MTYNPSMYWQSGVYRLTVGRKFLIGSTRCLGKRFSDHRVRLEKGEHPNPGLQSEWDATGTIDIRMIKEVPRKPEAVETDPDFTKRLQFWEQIELKQWFGKPGCANLSPRQRWQDPVFREARLAGMRGRKASVETREKMSRAKRGAGNPNARACVTWLAGERRQFGSAAEAASYHGVSKQVMDLWLRGVVSWPKPAGGRGRPTRFPALIGLTGSYC